ncbi:MAG TPA: hypothetical protein VFC29_21410 [Candidatus Limnocylindrales bacterium]|jgi:hypothetical protein|nr:hypothetical protein [Candidatus Limnocylindrales bacterium]
MLQPVLLTPKVRPPQVLPQILMRKFCDRAGQFHACRAAANDHKGEQRGATLRIGLTFGLFKGKKYPAANGGGVL